MQLAAVRDKTFDKKWRTSPWSCIHSVLAVSFLPVCLCPMWTSALQTSSALVLLFRSDRRLGSQWRDVRLAGYDRTFNVRLPQSPANTSTIGNNIIQSLSYDGANGRLGQYRARPSRDADVTANTTAKFHLMIVVQRQTDLRVGTWAHQLNMTPNTLLIIVSSKTYASFTDHHSPVFSYYWLGNCRILACHVYDEFITPEGRK